MLTSPRVESVAEQRRKAKESIARFRKAARRNINRPLPGSAGSKQ